MKILGFLCLLCGGLLVYLTQSTPVTLPHRVGPPQGKISIVVRKPFLHFFTGTLEIWDEDGLWKTYPVIVGIMPGNKTREGDKKTPEGMFYICTKQPSKLFHLSLGLSYPSLEHATQGLLDKRIDQQTYARIQRALDRKEQPPWNTALGGEIMIHGGGLVKFWQIFYVGTRGCIRMADAEMKEVYQYAKMGTRVKIVG